MDLDRLGPVLVTIGLVLAAAGALLWALGGLGLGRLPGDLSWRRDNVRIYVPLGSALLISIVLTVLLNLLLRR